MRRPRATNHSLHKEGEGERERDNANAKREEDLWRQIQFSATVILTDRPAWMAALHFWHSRKEEERESPRMNVRGGGERGVGVAKSRSPVPPSECTYKSKSKCLTMQSSSVLSVSNYPTKVLNFLLC